MSAERHVTLRRAGHADSRRLWQWRNDFATRQASRHRAWIPHGAHALWLVKVLPDPDRLLLIAEDTDVLGDPVAIGTVRLDRQGAAAAEINITVAPEYRGLGYGALMLRAIESEARATLHTRLIAEIRWSNRASLKLFWRGGYRLTSLRWGFVTLTKRLPPLPDKEFRDAGVRWHFLLHWRRVSWTGCWRCTDAVARVGKYVTVLDPFVSLTKRLDLRGEHEGAQ